MFWRAAQNNAKMRAGARAFRARARFARASADLSMVLCSPPEHRLQIKNRDFKKKHRLQKKTPRPVCAHGRLCGPRGAGERVRTYLIAGPYSYHPWVTIGWQRMTTTTFHRECAGEIMPRATTSSQVTLGCMTRLSAHGP